MSVTKGNGPPSQAPQGSEAPNHESNSAPSTPAISRSLHVQVGQADRTPERRTRSQREPEYDDLVLAPPFGEDLRHSGRTGNDVAVPYEAPPTIAHTPPQVPSIRLDEIDEMNIESILPEPSIPTFTATYPSLPAYYRGITDPRIIQLIDALAEPSLGSPLDRVVAPIPAAADSDALRTLQQAYHVLRPRRISASSTSPPSLISTLDNSPASVGEQVLVRRKPSDVVSPPDLSPQQPTSVASQLSPVVVISAGDEAQPLPTTGFAVRTGDQLKKMVPPTLLPNSVTGLTGIGQQSTFLSQVQAQAIAQERWRQQQHSRAQRIQSLLQSSSLLASLAPARAARNEPLYSLSAVLHDPTEDTQSYLTYYYNHYVWGVGAPENPPESVLPEHPELDALASEETNPALSRYAQRMGLNSEALARHIRRSERARLRARRLLRQRLGREQLQQQIAARLISEKIAEAKAALAASPSEATSSTGTEPSRMTKSPSEASSSSTQRAAPSVETKKAARKSSQIELDPAVLAAISQEAEAIAEKEAVAQTIGVPMVYLDSDFSVDRLPFLTDMSHEPILPWEMQQQEPVVPSIVPSTVSSPTQGFDHALEESLTRYIDAVEAQLQTQATAKAHLFARALDSIETLCEAANEQRSLVTTARAKVREAETALANSALSTLLLQRKQARLLAVVGLLEALQKAKSAPAEIRMAISERSFGRAVSITTSTAKLLAGPLKDVKASSVSRAKLAETAILLGHVLVEEAITAGFTARLASRDARSQHVKFVGSPLRRAKRESRATDDQDESEVRRIAFDADYSSDDFESEDEEDPSHAEESSDVDQSEPSLHESSTNDFLLLVFMLGMQTAVEEPLAAAAELELKRRYSSCLARCLVAYLESRLAPDSKVKGTSSVLTELLPTPCAEALLRCGNVGEQLSLVTQWCEDFFDEAVTANENQLSTVAGSSSGAAVVKPLHSSQMVVNSPSCSPRLSPVLAAGSSGSEVPNAPLARSPAPSKDETALASGYISALVASLGPRPLFQALQQVAGQIQAVLDALASFTQQLRDVAASVPKPDPALVSIWRASPSAASVSPTGSSTSSASIEHETHQLVKKLMTSVSERAHRALAKVLSSFAASELPGAGVTRLTLRQTQKIFELCLDFIAESEELTEGHTIYCVRGATIGLAKAFLNAHHAHIMSALASQLDKETWSRVDVGGEIQEVVCSEYGARKCPTPSPLQGTRQKALYAIVYPTLYPTFPPPKTPYVLPPAIASLEAELLAELKAGATASRITADAGTEGSLTASDHKMQQTGVGTDLAFTSTPLYAAPFPIVASVIRFIHDFKFYLVCARKLPPIAAAALSKLLELVKLFNSRTCQLVLGAGAMRTAGLKAITATQLALAAQSVGFVATQLTTAKHIFTQLLPARQRNLILPLSVLERDLLNHRQETLLKLPEIVGSLVDNACARVAASPWAALALAQSKGWIRKHAEMQSRYNRLVATGLTPAAALEAVKRQIAIGSSGITDDRRTSGSNPSSPSPPPSPFIFNSQQASSTGAQEILTEFEFVPGKPLMVFGHDVSKLALTPEDEDTSYPDAPISALAKQLTNLHRALSDLLTQHDRDAVMTEVARLCGGLLFRHLSKFDLSHPVTQIRIHANASFVLSNMQELTGKTDICRELKVFLLFDEPAPPTGMPSFEQSSDSRSITRTSTENGNDRRLEEEEKSSRSIDHEEGSTGPKTSSAAEDPEEMEEIEIEYEEDFEEDIDEDGIVSSGADGATRESEGAAPGTQNLPEGEEEEGT